MAAPRALSGALRHVARQPRLSAPPPIFAGWRCPRCTRAFASLTTTGETSKRQMQTATAYQPSSLPSHPLPPPPRNSGVPDTSIAGTSEGPRPGVIANQDDRPSAASSGTTSGFSLPEKEAQRSDATTKTPRPRRSKLRPRKAAVTLTPKAVEQLRLLLDQPDPKLIRVGVKNRGCSGLAYHLEYVDKPGTFDETVEQDGVRVLVDSKALFSIIGSEMDWLEDKLSARFVFKNPNISMSSLKSMLPPLLTESQPNNAAAASPSA